MIDICTTVILLHLTDGDTLCPISGHASHKLWIQQISEDMGRPRGGSAAKGIVTPSASRIIAHNISSLEILFLLRLTHVTPELLAHYGNIY